MLEYQKILWRFWLFGVFLLLNVVYFRYFIWRDLGLEDVIVYIAKF